MVLMFHEGFETGGINDWEETITYLCPECGRKAIELQKDYSWKCSECGYVETGQPIG